MDVLFEESTKLLNGWEALFVAPNGSPLNREYMGNIPHNHWMAPITIEKHSNTRLLQGYIVRLMQVRQQVGEVHDALLQHIHLKNHQPPGGSMNSWGGDWGDL